VLLTNRRRDSLPEHLGGDVVEDGQYGLLRIESVLGYDLGRQWSAHRAGDVFTEDRVSVAAGSACALSDGCFLHDGGQRPGETVLDPPE
jgi:hypothetical protein